MIVLSIHETILGKVYIFPSNYYPIDNVPSKLSIWTISTQTTKNCQYSPNDKNIFNKIKI
jgi:hypothetical protein